LTLTGEVVQLAEHASLKLHAKINRLCNKPSIPRSSWKWSDNK